MNEIAKEMSAFSAFVNKIKTRIIILRRKFIPYMVFYGQEIDVLITMKEDVLHKDADKDHAMKQLRQGHFALIEKSFADVGITFDRGLGFTGRDWEWDYSLKGPISVKFKKRHTGERNQ